jgi:hypothetical protein
MKQCILWKTNFNFYYPQAEKDFNTSNCMDVIEFLLNSPVSNICFIHLSSGYTLSKLAHFAIETNFILFYRMA